MIKKYLKQIIKAIMQVLGTSKLERVGSYYMEITNRRFSDINSLGKALTYTERFREVVSDPLNLLIERVPNAGYVDPSGNVLLHNGASVALYGPHSYYGRFSDLLVINRGVHEPLEEYCFQELLKKLKYTDQCQTMLELGAYWGHYSLWFSKEVVNSECVLVEPDPDNLRAGEQNFANNGIKAEFIKSFVGHKQFSVDDYIKERRVSELTLLHSDIQGYEIEMLEDCSESLSNGVIKYVMISTHGDNIHKKCLEILDRYDLITEVSSTPRTHSTSSDGFIFARRKDLSAVLPEVTILGRLDIAKSTAGDKLRYLKSLYQD